ncbi:MAG: hypothetical protein IKU73_05945 [Clostridia bacterium]|nr:hypothetical protein [Clostridia bacterium]
MGHTTVSHTTSHSTTESKSKSKTESQAKSESKSTTQKLLDEKLRDQILAGLMGYMTDEEIDAYARNLLEPQLGAQMEAAQQDYDTKKLMREQEIEDLAAALSRDVEAQEKAYRQSAAGVETAALARGMGRSSYTLDKLAQQGTLLAEAVERLTGESERKRGQIQAQITQAGEQKTQTQGRLQTDYAKELAAKVQELRDSQRKQYNADYLSAVNASMGSQTTGESSTKGTSTTDTKGFSETHGESTTVTTSGGGGGGSSRKSDDQVDAVSGAAPSVKNRKY